MTTETWKWVRQAARWAMAGCFALGGAASAWAGDAPPVQIMLRYKPSQDGVVYTIPKPEEEAGLQGGVGQGRQRRQRLDAQGRRRQAAPPLL